MLDVGGTGFSNFNLIGILICGVTSESDINSVFFIMEVEYKAIIFFL